MGDGSRGFTIEDLKPTCNYAESFHHDMAPKKTWIPRKSKYLSMSMFRYVYMLFTMV